MTDPTTTPRRPPRSGGFRPTGSGAPTDRFRGSRVDPARRVAYEALAAVHRDDAYANLVLPRLLVTHRVTGRDAAFATELVYGTLRFRGQLDAVITAAADRAVDRIDPPARDALRLGAYQVLHLRVPAHAAVATTVDLVQVVAPAAAGFANAVLRRMVEQDLDAWLVRLAPDRDTDPYRHLALTRSHPLWIVRAFADALRAGGDPSGPGDVEELDAALAANNERPEVHLCARPGRIDPVELVDQTGGTPGVFSPYAVYLPAGSPGDLAAVAGGRAHVQDEGSQLVTLAVAEAELTGTDTRWLDLCAGPGGKAALLGCLAGPRAATVTAVELQPHRADLVEQAVAGLPVQVIRADGREVGREPELPAGGFDRVLVDAPCTGLGALRRRPEARWRRTPDDLAQLSRLQRELLGAALRAVRPGGLVGYVTCSPHVVETRVAVAEAIRRSGVAVEQVDARAALAAPVPGLGAGPSVQLWPHRHGTDAMFLALVRRVDADGGS
jgi:16S rRNA (cytosine967-C5)-methyltransferase